jgi:2-keto-4-pentenoate hydratase/2-oxohepta-3-ene-1,7-dioic acid hydratase in catechol pathway
MKFITFTNARRTGAGLLTKNCVIDLGIAFFEAFRKPHKFPDVLSFMLQGGPEKLRDIDLAQFQGNPKVEIDPDAVVLRSPITRPPKITCVGLNYRDHAEEQGKQPPEKPLLFPKAANIVVGPGDPVLLNQELSTKNDFEAEFAVVIGKDGYQVPLDEAEDHIFGYTIMNDVTARDLQKGDGQWYRGKSLNTFAPLGPMIITADDYDPEGARIMMKVNGEVMQKSSLDQLIFRPKELVSYISAAFPLEVGDIIATGTPGGVGVFRDPPVFLKPGDVMEASIDGIGTLFNPVDAL